MAVGASGRRDSVDDLEDESPTHPGEIDRATLPPEAVSLPEAPSLLIPGPSAVQKSSTISAGSTRDGSSSAASIERESSRSVTFDPASISRVREKSASRTGSSLERGAVRSPRHVETLPELDLGLHALSTEANSAGLEPVELDPRVLREPEPAEHPEALTLSPVVRPRRPLTPMEPSGPSPTQREKAPDSAIPEKLPTPPTKAPLAERLVKNPTPIPSRRARQPNDLDRRKAESLFVCACADAQDGSIDGARANLQLAAALDPDKPEYRRALDELIESDDDTPPSLALPKSPRARSFYAEALVVEGRGETDTAARLLEKALGDSQEGLILNRLGLIVAAAGKNLNRARDLLAEATKKDPLNPVFQHNLDRVLAMIATGQLDAKLAAQTEVSFWRRLFARK
ncbi:MAG: hypothetical protein HYV07_23150 [Deltaproteobacteria bacterium]|nr:hypothetical protein [Deltaproteobacteria bacterium]